MRGLVLLGNPGVPPSRSPCSHPRPYCSSREPRRPASPCPPSRAGTRLPRCPQAGTMLEEPALPLFTAKGDQARGLLNTEIGPLQQQLRAGEYEAFRYAPLFESDFIQVGAGPGVERQS